MLGLSRNDASQQQAAAKYRDSFMPYRGGYAIKPSRHAGPIMITPEQREQLVEAYSEAFLRSMRIMIALLLGGLALAIAAVVLWNVPLIQWPFMLYTFAIVGLVVVLQQRAMRQAIAALGPRPSVLSADYAEWQRQRLRDRPWAGILIPALVIPFIALRWHTHFPPRDGDDYFAIVFLAALAALFIWAIVRKLQAGRA
jgi:hypothetical protein